ncbi:MAG: hypothetical protein JWN48_3093 [Myxococcaceae bacterium]|nr:hypothetical protein [Myxococcaceae bacterium]
MRSCLASRTQVAQPSRARALLWLGAFLVGSQLLGCVGEIKKGTLSEPALEPGDASHAADAAGSKESGAIPFTDGAARPDEPHGSIRDGQTSPGTLEAGVLTQQPADAQVNPTMHAPDAQVADSGSTTPGTKPTPVFVAVGYSGVRMSSKDLGKTWGNVVVSDPTHANKDDQNLLRSVKFGAGLFVAVGYKIWTSPDAVSWTERTSPTTQWMGGMQYGNNLFVAAGGSGTSIYSSDGISWTTGKDRGGEPARTVAFGNGMFVAGTDQNNWWTTSNGQSWSVLSGGHNGSTVVWCNGKAFSDAAGCSDPLARNEGRTALGEGVYVSAAGGKIERSLDGGKTWTMAADTSANPVTDVGFGYLEL